MSADDDNYDPWANDPAFSPIKPLSDQHLIQANPYVGNVMINVRGRDVEEFKENVKALADAAPEIAENLSTIAAVGRLHEALGATPVKDNKPAPSGGTPPPPPPVAAPTNGPSCVHGPMKFHQGVSKSTGKPYKMWKCTAPRDQECRAQFIN